MSTAFLFPGQGSQQPHMLRHLPDHPLVTETLAEASEALNESVVLWDTELKLRSTIAVQVCLLVSGVVSARLLMEEKAVPDYVAGHSVGAFGAAVVAGSLDFRDAIRLVRWRGEWMEKAFPKGYGMCVVVGLSEKQLSKLIEGHSTKEKPVYLANINCPRQMTIAGAIPDLRNLMETALANGAQKAELLDVSVPSHCPLLQDVSLRLDAELNDISFRDPTIPYIGNQTARALKKGEAIKKDLAWNVSHSVRWHESMSLLYELGTRLFVEMLPGNVLKRLVNNAFSTARAISISGNGIKTAAILVDRTRTN
ncbi:malonate decarboxylase subunit epsilon [Halobacillus shinanisalinarum]|uniref:Malonyl CoA-acyl carrier protein transacylase n=1 Tax=Halobacillus shinanisalinarum TaxID=2932258 RepID=A0ABY4GY12_9BACI|nr:malonate decarboxylase subunit epsilon [Halobacillus shinanisalinarum]UOQ92312.1 malonate decarboxylase subunit epsilon [Halobacillus shinanisalinarum]